MNNKGDFFVMLTTQDGGCTPLLQNNILTGKDEFATFTNRRTACSFAENSRLGRMFGYEVFERGYGVKVIK